MARIRCSHSHIRGRRDEPSFCARRASRPALAHRRQDARRARSSLHQERRRGHGRRRCHRRASPRRRPRTRRSSGTRCSRWSYPSTDGFDAFARLADADGHAASQIGGGHAAGAHQRRRRGARGVERGEEAAASDQVREGARADLYAVLKTAARMGVDYEQKRFIEVTLAKFRNAGAALATEAERAELSRLDAAPAALSNDRAEHQRGHVVGDA